VLAAVLSMRRDFRKARLALAVLLLPCSGLVLGWRQRGACMLAVRSHFVAAGSPCERKKLVTRLASVAIAFGMPTMCEQRSAREP
jgi:hypothetical protein